MLYYVARRQLNEDVMVRSDGDVRRTWCRMQRRYELENTTDMAMMEVYSGVGRKEAELRRSASERPPPRGIVKTKPVLPRGRESRSLYRVHDRNEERACARTRSQKRQEVVGSFVQSTGSYGLRMAD